MLTLPGTMIIEDTKTVHQHTARLQSRPLPLLPLRPILPGVIVTGMTATGMATAAAVRVFILFMGFCALANQEQHRSGVFSLLYFARIAALPG